MQMMSTGPELNSSLVRDSDWPGEAKSRICSARARFVGQSDLAGRCEQIFVAPAPLGQACWAGCSCSDHNRIRPDFYRRMCVWPDALDMPDHETKSPSFCIAFLK